MGFPAFCAENGVSYVGNRVAYAGFFMCYFVNLMYGSEFLGCFVGFFMCFVGNPKCFVGCRRLDLGNAGCKQEGGVWLVSPKTINFVADGRRQSLAHEAAGLLRIAPGLAAEAAGNSG